MALSSTNINSEVVKTTLGSTTSNISLLCSHSNINKWSKYKPVSGTWPNSSGTYGLNINTWNYTDKPTSNYNLSHFAKYEHNTTPAIGSITSENTVRTITPYPPGSDYSNIWKLRCMRTSYANGLTLTDLGLNSYYYGIKITNNTGTYYKTYGSVSSIDDNGLQFSVNCTLTDPNTLTFQDLPYGSGTYVWSLFISSSSATNWTTSTPSNIKYFPSETIGGISYTSSGTFTVNVWKYASDTNMSWTYGQSGSGVAQTSTIIYPVEGSYTFSKPVWITCQVWDDIWLTHEEDWISDTYLKIYPTTPNTGSARSGNVVVTTPAGNITISVSQTGNLPAYFNFVDPLGFDLVEAECSVDYTIGSSTIIVNFAVTGYSGILPNRSLRVCVYKSGVTNAVATKVISVKDYPPYTFNTGTLTLSSGSVQSGHVYTIRFNADDTSGYDACLPELEAPEE